MLLSKGSVDGLNIEPLYCSQKSLGKDNKFKSKDGLRFGNCQNLGLTLQQCYSFRGRVPSSRFSTYDSTQEQFTQSSELRCCLIVILVFALYGVKKWENNLVKQKMVRDQITQVKKKWFKPYKLRCSHSLSSF